MIQVYLHWKIQLPHDAQKMLGRSIICFRALQIIGKNVSSISHASPATGVGIAPEKVVVHIARK